MRNEPIANGAAPDSAADLSRGTNQSGVRLYNERLILTLIRRRGRLSKVEIAHLTGLSVQTAAGIMNRLEEDGLLLRQDPRRGRVGQPAVPFVLNPEGALSLGIKIGRRSSDLVLVDFTGEVRERVRATYPYPVTEQVLAFASSGIERLTRGLSDAQRRRITGLGIAAPFELWNWGNEVGAPATIMEAWRRFDIAAEIGRLCDWPVTFCNDGTAACAAEFFFGEGWRSRDFIYFFIGSFIGGGVVLNGTLFPGRTGNAGAVGSMPVPMVDPEGRLSVQQLIRNASIYVLEKQLIAAGRDPSAIWQSPQQWAGFDQQLDAWIEEITTSLALVVVSAISVIDFEAAVIDGAFPAAVRERITGLTAEKVALLDRQGLSPVTVRAGTIGSDARAIGGAVLPLLARFSRDRDIMFKEPAGVERG